MEDIEYFDYYRAAEEMLIPQEIVTRVENDVKNEFPDDKMMYELHVLRVLKSKYWEKASGQRPLWGKSALCTNVLL